MQRSSFCLLYQFSRVPLKEVQPLPAFSFGNAKKVTAHYGQARQGGFDHQQREEIRGIVREEMAASSASVFNLLRCAGQTPAETSEDANAPDETDLDNLLDMMGN